MCSGDFVYFSLCSHGYEFNFNDFEWNIYFLLMYLGFYCVYLAMQYLQSVVDLILADLHIMKLKKQDRNVVRITFCEEGLWSIIFWGLVQGTSRNYLDFSSLVVQDCNKGLFKKDVQILGGGMRFWTKTLLRIVKTLQMCEKGRGDLKFTDFSHTSCSL